jgi:hypothetical protein
MNKETCIKYLDYVSQECEKYLRDSQVTDDELVNLIIEFQRFQDKTLQSQLPEEIKNKIAEIKLDFSIKQVERGNWYLIAAFLTFGSWAIFIHMRKQAKRKEALNMMKFDVSRLSTFIKLND